MVDERAASFVLSFVNNYVFSNVTSVFPPASVQCRMQPDFQRPSLQGLKRSCWMRPLNTSPPVMT